MTKHYLHVQDSIRLAAIDKFSEAFPTEQKEENKLVLLEIYKSS